MTNIQRYAKRYEQHSLIAEVDEVQIELTKLYIQPSLDKLQEIGLNFRRELDAVITSKKLDHPWFTIFQGAKNLIESYPVGACYLTTKIFKAYLKEHPVDFLKAFEEKGGVIKMVWGIIKENYFQTQMQMGAIFLDVANDAVDIDKPKTNIETYHETTFRNVRDLQDFIQIKEKYHGSVIRLNTVPIIKDYFPLIDIRNGCEILQGDIFHFFAEHHKLNIPADVRCDANANAQITDFFNKFPKVMLNPNDDNFLMRLKRTVKFFNVTHRKEV